MFDDEGMFEDDEEDEEEKEGDKEEEATVKIDIEEDSPSQP